MLKACRCAAFVPKFTSLFPSPLISTSPIFLAVSRCNHKSLMPCFFDAYQRASRLSRQLTHCPFPWFNMIETDGGPPCSTSPHFPALTRFFLLRMDKTTFLLPRHPPPVTGAPFLPALFSQGNPPPSLDCYRFVEFLPVPFFSLPAISRWPH